MERFPDNARVCFVGDSITATYDHPARVADYYLTRFPGCGMRFYCCGVAGGTARSQRIFLKDDTLCHKPTHAVLMRGVNDSARWLLGEEKSARRYEILKARYDDYTKNLPMLCDELEKENVKITLCTPVPYAEYQETAQPPLRGGYALIAGYADFCRRFAAERGYPLCDYHAYFAEKMQTEDLFGPDHIHPVEKGQYYMAKCFLEFQGLEIGEFAPIPEKYEELRRVSMLVRNIFAVELMVIGDLNYDKTTEEKLRIVQDYIDAGKAPTDYFKNITAQYMQNKCRQDELARLTHELTEQVMG